MNTNGVLYTAQAAGRQMARFGNGGSIILIASMSGTITNKVRTSGLPLRPSPSPSPSRPHRYVFPYPISHVSSPMSRPSESRHIDDAGTFLFLRAVASMSICTVHRYMLGLARRCWQECDCADCGVSRSLMGRLRGVPVIAPRLRNLRS